MNIECLMAHWLGRCSGWMFCLFSSDWLYLSFSPHRTQPWPDSISPCRFTPASRKECSCDQRVQCWAIHVWRVCQTHKQFGLCSKGQERSQSAFSIQPLHVPSIQSGVTHCGHSGLDSRGQHWLHIPDRPSNSLHSVQLFWNRKLAAAWIWSILGQDAPHVQYYLLQPWSDEARFNKVIWTKYILYIFDLCQSTCTYLSVLRPPLSN